MPDPNAKTIKKSDYNRILVTETVPYETPLIFSNDGFYSICKKPQDDNSVLNLLFQRLVLAKGRKKFFTIPYQYKIRKTILDYRRLSVIHPISQWEMKQFYETYESLICHYCSISNFSIRAPQRTASVFYYKNSWENIAQYKRGAVEETGSDKRHKHSSSFFSYRGHDRLYKFFNSNEFISLEKDFASLQTLDVSKCFDSIYTHSIAWATKEKQYVKSKIGLSTFGAAFDSLMQRANYNETNGIVIGPEISRIFAEIIFQDIDQMVQARLAGELYRYEHGVNYSIKRYVDDVFIFAKEEKISRKIYEVYADCLNSYNLHVNSSKSLTYTRPFFTAKSKVVREVNQKVNEFSEKFLESKNGNSILIPKEIHRVDRLVHSFIDSIKATCSTNSVGYDEVSSYLISAFFERVKRLINIDSVDQEDGSIDQYRDAVIVFLELIFFFYSVAPSVSASYKLCASVILLSRFSEMYLGPYEHTIKQRIYELAVELLQGDLGAVESDVDNFIFLEALNVILAISDMGDDYLLPPELILKLFQGKNSYYDLVACLFYVKDRDQYLSIQSDIISRIERRLVDLNSIQTDAEQACLFLDSISCPYIDRKKRSRWIYRFYQASSAPKPVKQQIDDFIENTDENFWFVNWNEVDLLNALERKELRQVY
ncbi:antiviral reverse transcriptase Drt3b [Pseudomonas sp. MH10]|uniref:antiviral reverse transcriptase Drt3b n=1 Tax=Pseudomonas sp. MH10 TaxID=3048627 RepID=UPI002AC8E01F|nr:antiviral reverse transcriptase Drt3b [Pseudomonas sp. MH10]MEB0040892.1 RNA-directed DNA polymerase [Pseudomonas sp. MH10]WPX64402.1 antiviral reverse transcriptase Drt3b [Pseudomonas sp. MH10]